jgi:hypothetical protein
MAEQHQIPDVTEVALLRQIFSEAELQALLTAFLAPQPYTDYWEVQTSVGLIKGRRFSSYDTQINGHRYHDYGLDFPGRLKAEHRIAWFVQVLTREFVFGTEVPCHAIASVGQLDHLLKAYKEAAKVNKIFQKFIDDIESEMQETP